MNPNQTERTERSRTQTTSRFDSGGQESGTENKGAVCSPLIILCKVASCALRDCHFFAMYSRTCYPAPLRAWFLTATFYTSGFLPN